MNNDLRAAENDVIAKAFGPTYFTDRNGRAVISLYSFESADDAKGFMELTADQAICPDDVEYNALEGSDEGELDLFSDDVNDGAVVWAVVEVYSLGRLDDPQAGEGAFVIDMDLTATANDSVTDFSSTDLTLTAYERHGSVVIVTSLIGSCCTEGFSNEAAMAESDYTPTMTDLVSALSVLRPYVLARI